MSLPIPLVVVPIIVIVVLALAALDRRRLARRLYDGTATPREMSAAAGCAPLLLGVALLCMVAGCGVPLALISRGEIAFAESNQPIAGITPAMDGQKVLLEGAISIETAVDEHGLAAYERYTVAKKRRLERRHTPPLQIDLPGQQARIENPAEPAAASYLLDGLDQRQGAPNRRTYGLAPGDRVLVIGIVRQGRDGAYLDAAVVFAGDRAGYLAAKRTFLTKDGPLIAGGASVIAIALLLYAFSAGAIGGGRRRPGFGR